MLTLNRLLLSQEGRRLHEEDGKGTEDGIGEGVRRIPARAMIRQLLNDRFESAQQRVNREALE